MNNPAVHDLDDVRLRAENGQLVLEVAGQTTPVDVDVDGGLSLDELEGFTDDEISLLQSKLVDAGHDEVDVPQVRNLTVEDWESGVLPDAFDGERADATVVSDPTSSGRGYVLEQTNGSSAGERTQLYSFNGLSSYVQVGDEFSKNFYLTDSNDQIWISVLTQSVGIKKYNAPSYHFAVRSDTDEIFIRDDPSGNTTSTSISISSHLNEWLTLEGEIHEDYTLVAELKDNTGEQLASVEHTPINEYEAGGLHYYVANPNTSTTIYHDGISLNRRVGEYTSETQKGTTELGNEVTPLGAIHTGPLESNTNALRQEYATAPVNSNATQGDTSLLTLLKSGVNPAAYMERTFDGQGGAYGHQLQAALGRFARINANLSWEYDSLADVPNWESAAGSASNWTFNVNGRPRRIHLEHDGSGGSDDNGGVQATALTTFESLGEFRVTFHDVDYTDNETFNYLRVGLSDVVDAGTNIDNNGNGFFIEANGAGEIKYITVDSGTETQQKRITGSDWNSKRDLTIEYDGSTVTFIVDGGAVNFDSYSYSVNSNFKPTIQLKEDVEATSVETVEVEQVTVEPLPEVLQ